ncbi:MAG: 30S ribosomal protein S9 [Candidatus Woesearchaeota archaeon]
MKNIHTSGKRKSAKARAVLKKGSGNISINGFSHKNYPNKNCVLMIEEPKVIAKEVMGEKVEKLDIDVNLDGGGQISGAEAARLAIAKAYVKYFDDEKLENAYDEYDRHLLVADVRRREPRKPHRSGKARAKRQKSYR